MQTELKDYKKEDLIEFIANITLVIEEYKTLLARLNAELYSRQDPNQPVQLELF
jgi:hypothetical protein